MLSGGGLRQGVHGAVEAARNVEAAGAVEAVQNMKAAGAVRL